MLLDQKCDFVQYCRVTLQKEIVFILKRRDLEDQRVERIILKYFIVQQWVVEMEE